MATTGTIIKNQPESDLFTPPVMASLRPLDTLMVEDMNGPTPTAAREIKENLVQTAAKAIPRSTAKELFGTNHAQNRSTHFVVHSDRPQFTPVLGSSDAALYNEIFALQDDENFKEADALIAKLGDKGLMGHVLAQRYLSKSYRTSFNELHAWLARYSDHPQAQRIQTLAVSKRKSGDAKLEFLAPRKVLRGFGDDNGLGSTDRLSKIRSSNWDGRENAYNFWTKLDSAIEGDNLETAEKMLFSSAGYKLLKATEFDVAQWQLAAHHLFRGNAKQAYNLAKGASKRSGDVVPQIHWIAAIAAKQLGYDKTATLHFIKMANAESGLSPWEKSAASFWSYRGLSEQGSKDKAAIYLEQAAQNPRTFYGVLARRIQGRSLGVKDSPMPNHTASSEKELYQTPHVRRAVGLVQAGNRELAEKELRYAFPQMDVAQREKLLALTNALDLPATQISISKALEKQGRSFPRAMYPTPGWTPENGGYTVDPALVFAFTRQESGFYLNATGPNGAQGVMQVMPKTAQLMEKYANVEVSGQMYDPETNVAVGQTYLGYLIDNKLVQGNLIYLAAAYNAGPGRIKQWRENVTYRDDPLLFLESMPYGITRNYVAQVLTNYWIYQEMEGRTTHSALALSQGQWPEYDAGLLRVATNTADDKSS